MANKIETNEKFMEYQLNKSAESNEKLNKK